MSLDFKLSELHKSSLPILEYVRDVAHAFPERPDVSIRIVTLLANLTEGEFTVDCLKEIVSLLKGDDGLIERCSGLVLGEGKLEVVASEDGSRIVTVCPEDGGLRLTLWSSDAVVEMKGAERTPTRKRRGRPLKNAGKSKQEGNVAKKKRGLPAKKDGNGTNDGQKPAKRRRGRPRKNALVALQDNVITDGETGNAAMKNDGGDIGYAIMIDSDSPKPTFVNGGSNVSTGVGDQKPKPAKRRRGRPRKINQAGAPQPTGTESVPPQSARTQDGPPQPTAGGEVNGNAVRKGRPRRKPQGGNQQPRVANNGGLGVVKRRRGRPRKNNRTASENVVDRNASVTVAPADKPA
jgi:hypothetical protein